MAESLAATADIVNTSDRSGAASSGESSVGWKRIDFVPARKPFAGLENSGKDFGIEALNPSNSDGSRPCSSGSQSVFKTKKTDGSELGLEPEFNFGITFRRIGAGLVNLGNTCFLNSVLQCLTYTEPLAAYLQSGKHQNSCHIAGFCALCAIQKHVSRALQSSGRILAPKDLVSNLRCISRNFRNARQEDAHEYMVNLLESMHKCCLPSGVSSESPNAYEKSLVHKIFGGRLRSQVKCMQCSYCSNKFDPFLDLSLDIVKVDSLLKALKNFTNAELLDGGERRYQCQRCKEKVVARKQLTVDKAPYVLTIHLKRFHPYNPEGKIHKKVQFDTTLDMKPFVSGAYDGDLKYTLYGVLVHQGGSTRSGHYYCYVRTSSGMWYALDDNRVFHVGDKIVLGQQAYMLFYVRDRKTVVPKKPADVALKENISAPGNKMNCIVNQGFKGQVQSSIAENRCSGTVSPADVKRKDAFCFVSSAITNVKEESIQQDKSAVATEKKSSVAKECLMQEKIPLSLSSSLATSSNQSSERLCSPNQNWVKDVPPLAGCENSNPSLHLKNDGARCAGVEKIHDEKSCLDGLLSVSIAATQDNADPNVSSSDSLRKVAITANETSVAYSLDENASDKVRNVAIQEYVKVSSRLIISNGSLQLKAFYGKRNRRFKRRLLKCLAGNFNFRSNIIFWAMLSRQKKKHQKRKSRQQARRAMSRTNTISSDEGPSTSENTRKNFTIPIYSQGKMPKCGATVSEHDAVAFNRKSNNEESPMHVTVTQVKSIHVSSSFSDLGEAEEAPKRSRTMDGSAKMLTSSLGETFVGRWDGIDLPPTQIVDSNGGESVSTGYVTDEWDVEYDGGKRKKLRHSKHYFGERNPFQEIAAKKSHLKNKDRTSSGNRPFRI